MQVLTELPLSAAQQSSSNAFSLCFLLPRLLQVAELTSPLYSELIF